MFAYFRGILRDKTPTYAVIECQGVGYLLNISLNTFTQLPDPGTDTPVEAMLYAYPIVREDSHQLFGFTTTEERDLFAHLISVSGVGANTARMILSAMQPDGLVHAIVSGDAASLSRIKGIGSKTASRIILDLKDKAGSMRGPGGISAGMHNTVQEEALSALLMLGFSRAPAEKALQRVQKEKGAALSLEDWIKAALRFL